MRINKSIKIAREKPGILYLRIHDERVFITDEAMRQLIIDYTTIYNSEGNKETLSSGCVWDPEEDCGPGSITRKEREQTVRLIGGKGTLFNDELFKQVLQEKRVVLVDIFSPPYIDVK